MITRLFAVVALALASLTHADLSKRTEMISMREIEIAYGLAKTVRLIFSYRLLTR